MLEKYTLDAVFSLPEDMFYPGASAVACCMVFDLSQKHERSNRDTFFGYFKDDKFVKRKGLGRVEITDDNGNSLWIQTEKVWLELYRNRRELPGFSVMHRVTYKDEWLAEAYLEKDYSNLSVEDFYNTINLFFSYVIAKGSIHNTDKKWMDEYISSLYGENTEKAKSTNKLELKTNGWKDFRIGKLFEIYPTKSYSGMSYRDLHDGGDIPVIANSSLNNGIKGFSTLEPTENGGIITFSDTTEGNTFFYQPEPFIGFSHVQGMHSLNHQWTEKQLLFMVTILSFANADLFNYGRKMRRDTISDSIIKLPAKKDENGYVIDNSNQYSDEGFVPDWEWMEDYIKLLPYSDRI